MGVCAHLCGSVPGKEVVEERIPIVNKVAILCNTLTSPSSFVSLLLENGASCLSLFFGVFGCMLHFLYVLLVLCDCVHLPVCCSCMCSSVYEESLLFLPCLILMWPRAQRVSCRTLQFGSQLWFYWCYGEVEPKLTHLTCPVESYFCQGILLLSHIRKLGKNIKIKR